MSDLLLLLTRRLKPFLPWLVITRFASPLCGLVPSEQRGASQHSQECGGGALGAPLLLCTRLMCTRHVHALYARVMWLTECWAWMC